MISVKHRRLNYPSAITVLLVIAVATAIVSAPKVLAHVSTNQAFNQAAIDAGYNNPSTPGCGITEIDASSQESIGTGFVYRTIEISAHNPGGTVGKTARTNCTISGQWNGMAADQIWFGPQAGTAGKDWSAKMPPRLCSDLAPTNPGINRCPTTPNPYWEVQQDDASMIKFDGQQIACNGMREFCGDDVFRNGVEGNMRYSNHSCASHPEYNRQYCAVAGAGFLNTSPIPLKSGADAGRNSFDVEVWSRSTWSGGWGASFILTMRLPQKNVDGIDLTPSCTNRNVRVRVNADSSITPTVEYFVNGSRIGTRTSRDFTFSMSGYNQRNSYTVMARTTVGGKTVSDSATYGPCEFDTDTCNEIPPSETLNMPNTAPNTGGPPSYGWSPHYEYNPTGRSAVTSVQDISPGIGGVNIPYSGGTNHRVTLYYSNFENTYPYDNNQARVNYVSYYNTTVYQPSGGAVYSAWYNVCTRYEYVNVGTKKKPRYEYRCTRTRRQRDLLGYRYVYQYTTYNNQSPGAVNGSYLSPCYDRAFELTPSTTGVTFNDYENPSTVTFSSMISSRFSLPEGNKALRRPMQVTFGTYGSFYVKRADESIYTYPQGAISRQIGSAQTIGSTYTPGTLNGSYADTFSATMPPLQVGDRACFTIGVPTSAGRMNIGGGITRVTRGSLTSQETCSAPLVNHPYMRVYGGDVLAGSGFGVSCSINNAAGIISWNRGNGAGSAVQFAAQAAGAITDFSSSIGGSPPKGLSFANTIGTYGGNFGSGLCGKDYWAAARDVRSSYRSTGQVVPESARQVTYVDGDAYLYGNILYSNSSGWTSIDKIPSFYLIVRGNIYIDRAVTQLDGVYIAQPHPNRSNTGRIYTCTANDRIVTSTAAFSTCSQRLTINGAFMAQQVRFLRTNGSLRNSSPNEGRTSPTIAEVFNYSPELYLVDPAVFEVPPKQYESATGLPPIL